MTDKQRLVIKLALEGKLYSTAESLAKAGLSRSTLTRCIEKRWVYRSHFGRLRADREGRRAFDGSPQVECQTCDHKIERVGRCSSCTSSIAEGRQ